MISERLMARLAEKGLQLPSAPKPIASYVPAARSGNLVFVSGQLPMVDGKLSESGRVPGQVTIERAQNAAGVCVLNALAVLGAELGGDFDRLVRVVRIGVFVASDDLFTEQAKVANGASDLLAALLGEAGRHARAAVGVNALPLGAAVEVEALFEVA